jgi:chloramphenicol O-acetyltransferase
MAYSSSSSFGKQCSSDSEQKSLNSTNNTIKEAEKQKKNLGSNNKYIKTKKLSFLSIFPYFLFIILFEKSMRNFVPLLVNGQTKDEAKQNNERQKNQRTESFKKVCGVNGMGNQFFCNN